MPHSENKKKTGPPARRAPYPEAVKEEIVSLYRSGQSMPLLEKTYGIPRSTISRWVAGGPAEARLPEWRKNSGAALKRRLDAIHALRFRHRIEDLCRVLHVRRRDYDRYTARPENLHDDTAVCAIMMRLLSSGAVENDPAAIVKTLKEKYSITATVPRIGRLLKTLKYSLLNF